MMYFDEKGEFLYETSYPEQFEVMMGALRGPSPHQGPLEPRYFISSELSDLTEALLQSEPAKAPLLVIDSLSMHEAVTNGVSGCPFADPIVVTAAPGVSRGTLVSLLGQSGALKHLAPLLLVDDELNQRRFQEEPALDSCARLDKVYEIKDMSLPEVDYVQIRKDLKPPVGYGPQRSRGKGKVRKW